MTLDELKLRIKNADPYVEIIGSAVNKNGELKVIGLTCGGIYLYDRFHITGNSASKLNYEIYKEEPVKVEIIDIVMEEPDCGNGTIVMKELIKLAIKENAESVYGELSQVDDGNADRRNHFYKKFGFIIKGDYIELTSDRFNRALLTN